MPPNLGEMDRTPARAPGTRRRSAGEPPGKTGFIVLAGDRRP